MAGVTEIEVSPTKHPTESLAHELLHAELKLKGYRQYLRFTGLVPRESINSYVALLGALDNELQHHRFFFRFHQLGLSGKRFYSDADKRTFAEVRKQVELMTRAHSTADFLLQFLSAIAPGGSSDEKLRKPLRNFIQSKCDPSAWATLLAVEELIREWRNGDTEDAGPTIAAILNLVSKGERFWVGPAVENPEAIPDFSVGHFVGAPFALEELLTFHRGK